MFSSARPFSAGLTTRLFRNGSVNDSSLALADGSRIAVVGGGPAGSFFSYFVLEMAGRIGLQLQVDIYEPRDFSVPGPAGCNMCGGIISESLVQHLAAEGIELPSHVVERGIDSYVLHMDEGIVRIDTPLHEKRIAGVHRGAGPRGIKEVKWHSFDGYLLSLAMEKGACLVKGRVDEIAWHQGQPQLKVAGGSLQTYDLLVAATGVNSSALKLFEKLGDYRAPETTKTYVSEFYLGQQVVEECLGNSMHVFLLHIPRLEFAALIPKGDYVTLCLLGEDIDGPLVDTFLNSPSVKRCLPGDWTIPDSFCHCSPKINFKAARNPYADRLVFIGDCGVTRLYKDGIGAAYRTAKAAAVTAVFDGISAEDFRRHYEPVCRSINKDNLIGKAIFTITRQIQKNSHDRRGIFRMVTKEQQDSRSARRMSLILWDVFTGSAPYREVLMRAFHPAFGFRFLWEIILGTLFGVAFTQKRVVRRARGEAGTAK